MRKSGLDAHKIRLPFWILKLNNFMLKHSLLLQLLHLLELTMEIVMTFTELAYLTYKMRYINILCNIQLIASGFALHTVAVKK